MKRNFNKNKNKIFIPNLVKTEEEQMQEEFNKYLVNLNNFHRDRMHSLETEMENLCLDKTNQEKKEPEK